MSAATDTGSAPPSIASGPPLDEEPGLGTLTLPGFLREVTAAYGEREALAMREAGRVTRWTYADLWERALEVACALRASGLGKDGRVGVLMTNRPEWISAVFGTSLAGGVAVTLSTFSTPSELDHLLRASCVSVLLFERTVAHKDFAEILTGFEPGIAEDAAGPLQSEKYPFLRHLAMVGEPASAGRIGTWESFLDRGRGQPRAAVEAAAATTCPSDTAVLFFSSGSTSLPKGILSAHRGVTTQLWRFRRMYGVGPDDHVRSWTANGFFWSGNFGMAIGTTLASGGSLVLQPTFNAEEALELMQAERVNLPLAWPHQWAQLEGAANWRDVDLGTLKFVDYNTPLAHHPTVSSEWFEPGHAYGNTETFTISTGFAANTPEDVHAGSSGEPFPGNTVKIVDPLTGEVVPLGASGEICVKGPTLMLGYLGTPPDETLDAESFFHTGDSGYLDDADRLFWTGRLTDIIKTGGANVSPREVDEALAHHPSVKVTHTVGVPHETLGEMVVGCVVPHDGAAPGADELRAFLKERLASFKVPRRILFFQEEEISLTGSSKIKSDELRKMAAERL